MQRRAGEAVRYDGRNRILNPSRLGGNGKVCDKTTSWRTTTCISQFMVTKMDIWMPAF